MSRDPICVGCNKRPDELAEYIDACNDANDGRGLTPSEYVRLEEGLYNARNGHFFCTSCYVDVGVPLGVAP